MTEHTLLLPAAGESSRGCRNHDFATDSDEFALRSSCGRFGRLRTLIPCLLRDRLSGAADPGGPGADQLAGPPRILVSRTRPTEHAQHLAAALDGELVPMGSAGAKAMAGAKRNIINVPCMVNNWLYRSLDRNCRCGLGSSARISSAMRPAAMKNMNAVVM